MRIRVDPYDPCPCGSGKKFKFCCAAKGRAGRYAGGAVAGTIAAQGDTSPKRKMSEMISEMAADFLWVGDTIEERQSRLNAACSGWNMACESPELRQRSLRHYGEQYLQLNPNTTPADLASILKDMESLVARKLKMFPDDQRAIVSARVVKAGSQYRIEVASATGL